MKNQNQNGFSLFELMVACLIITILVCIAVPSPAAVANMMATHDAKLRVRTVANAVSTQNICNAQHVTCAGIAPLIPGNGIFKNGSGSYSYIMVGNNANYSYTANPTNPKLLAFYVDETSILRCATSQADANSPLCQ